VTKHEAKDLSVELWQSLADHPEINAKKAAAESILAKIRAWEPSKIVNCLCGAAPFVEQKVVSRDYGEIEIFKYKCPVCKEKELPWLRQWKDSGALQSWNRIAEKCSYHKRTLPYNVHGICTAPPYKTFEWKSKKNYDHVVIDFYLDNSMFYYRFDYMYKNSGHVFALSIDDKCFPSFEIAKQTAVKEILKNKKEFASIMNELFIPEQGDLFGTN